MKGVVYLAECSECLSVDQKGGDVVIQDSWLESSRYVGETSRPLTLINVGGAIIIHHRRIAFFSATDHRMNSGLVCKFKFCRCGPVEKNQSALSVSV